MSRRTRELDREGFFYRVGYNCATAEVIYIFATAAPALITVILFMMTAQHYTSQVTAVDNSLISTTRMFIEVSGRATVEALTPWLIAMLSTFGFLMLSLAIYPRKWIRRMVIKILLQKQLNLEKIDKKGKEEGEQLISLIHEKGFIFTDEKMP